MNDFGQGDYEQMATEQNRQRIKALEEELERQATSHPVDRVNESLDKYIKPASIEFPLTFEEFQADAKKTAIYNRDACVLYPALGLAGEVGELGEKVLAMAVHAGKAANQVKKIIRDDDCQCDTDRKHEIGKEIGGVLWYCAAVASDLGLNLGDIAQQNLDVLASRQQRGTIKGDGDNR